MDAGEMPRTMRCQRHSRATSIGRIPRPCLIHTWYDVSNDLIGREETQYESDGVTIASQTVQRNVFDGANMVLSFDANGNLTNRYLWGPAVDQVLADEQFDLSGTDKLPVTSGNTLWPLDNNQNSVTDVLNDAGTVEQHLAYSPFGAQTAQSTNPGSVIFVFGYTGTYTDTVTGDQLHGVRWLDPSTQRWMNQDPAGLTFGSNSYLYTNDNPMDYLDPSGLSDVKAATGQVGGFADLKDTPNVSSMPWYVQAQAASDVAGSAHFAVRVWADPEPNAKDTAYACKTLHAEVYFWIELRTGTIKGRAITPAQASATYGHEQAHVEGGLLQLAGMKAYIIRNLDADVAKMEDHEFIDQERGYITSQIAWPEERKIATLIAPGFLHQIVDDARARTLAKPPSAPHFDHNTFGANNALVEPGIHPVKSKTFATGTADFTPAYPVLGQFSPNPANGQANVKFAEHGFPPGLDDDGLTHGLWFMPGAGGSIEAINDPQEARRLQNEFASAKGDDNIWPLANTGWNQQDAQTQLSAFQ
jgi:RHS repeat-associated protein